MSPLPPRHQATSCVVAKSRRTLQQRTRELALQGVYRWLMNNTEVLQIAEEILNEANHKNHSLKKKAVCNALFFHRLLEGVIKNTVVLQDILEPHLDRSWEKISPTLQAILLLGTYELRDELVTPIQVILNEAVELARVYSSDDAYRYVNGILERCAATLREAEYRVMKQQCRSH